MEFITALLRAGWDVALSPDRTAFGSRDGRVTTLVLGSMRVIASKDGISATGYGSDLASALDSLAAELRDIAERAAALGRVRP